MGRIAWLWLLLTPVWIAFSFYASASKIAFIPPALVVVALVFYWLHNQFVLLVAGEREPRADVQLSQSQLSQSQLSQSQLSQSQLSQSSPFQPVAAASLVRPASVAIAVGACIGAAATSVFLFDRALHDSTVSEKSAATDAIQLGATIGVQPKAVKPQLFAAEQTTQNNSRVTSSENTDAKRAEVQTQTLGESATDQPRCNVSLCESYYQSFRASDCTYQPYSGPRQYCAR
jgi:BA14K-like protein